MSRLHPFDHAFAQLAATQFDAIREEAAGQHRDVRDHVQFAALPTVQRALQGIEDSAFLETQPEAAAEYVAALHAAFAFWLDNRTTLSPTTSAIESALDSPASWSAEPSPGGATYIQLPERLFWAQIDPASPHEPIDGMFINVNGTTRELAILAVLGLRHDRPGFSQLAVTGAFEDLEGLPADLRQPLFAPTIEGGAEAGVKSVTTGGEVLALALVGLAATGS
jgi:hypothetical protein